MDPLLFLPLNLKEEQLEEFQAEDDKTLLTPLKLEDDEQDSEIIAAIRQSEVDQRCRMCADKHKNMKPIFSTEAMELNLPFKMEKYLYIMVSEEDRLPLQVCVSCEAKLEMSVALAESCADAQTFLNNLLAPPDTELPDSPVAASPPASPEMLADNFSDNSEDAFPEPLENLPTTSDPIEEQQVEELINIGKVSTKPDAFVYFVCKKCSVPFVNMGDLENHYNFEHMVFLCRKGCQQIFNSSTKLDEHIKQSHDSHEPKELKKMEAEDELPLKRISHENNGKEISELKCPICDKVYKKKYELKVHILRHGGLTKKECPVCHKWLNGDNLSRHKKTHTPKKFVCDVCQRQFSCKRYLSLHFRTRHNGKDFVCDICKREFSLKRYVSDHIKLVHMTEWFYECKICNKKHKNVASIEKHVKTHKNVALTMESKFFVKKSNFHCSICNKYSANEKAFKGHLLTHKGTKKCAITGTLMKEPTLQCEMCAKMYKTITGLNLHIRGYHKGEKPQQCQYCPRRFLEKKSLKIHEKIHEGNLAFKCHLCPKSFVIANLLQVHISREHLDIRPFKCTYCVKAFHSSSRLRVHTRTHTGEKPFICKVCGRGFTQKYDMLKHEVSHSNEFLYNCKNCKFGSNRLKDLTGHTCNESVQS